MSRHRTPADTEKIASTRFLDDMNVEVSTVAIYCVGSHVSETPLVYETMVFAKGYPEIDQSEEYGERGAYTHEEAIAQHNTIVERVAAHLQVAVRTFELL